MHESLGYNFNHQHSKIEYTYTYIMFIVLYLYMRHCQVIDTYTMFRGTNSAYQFVYLPLVYLWNKYRSADYNNKLQIHIYI